MRDVFKPLMGTNQSEEGVREHLGAYEGDEHAPHFLLGTQTQIPIILVSLSPFIAAHGIGAHALTRCRRSCIYYHPTLSESLTSCSHVFHVTGYAEAVASSTNSLAARLRHDAREWSRSGTGRTSCMVDTCAIKGGEDQGEGKGGGGGGGGGGDMCCIFVWSVSS